MDLIPLEYTSLRESYNGIHALVDSLTQSLKYPTLVLVNKNFIGTPCYLMIDFCDMVG
jgi:hypothetical protein